ncbi:hypothetical protein FA13DRAFT_864367 [Coprinellus micaceus]|uniref:DUF6534 domain-containing protein n=1 Tax=Coprinellus micaceus TaxID=71717 RepID=A0A4Y7S0V0_COPMI|nr:hypothetical protein FA13DRAFT_864367 [Coprinellus micaceus]
MHDEALGAVLSACTIGVFLFGVQTIQTLTYYRRGHSDPLYLKMAVLLMWLLEFTHSSIVFTLVYKCFITYFGDPDGFSKAQRFLRINGVIAVLIAAVSQSYSAWRLHQLQTTKSWIIPSICWVASVLRFAIYVAAVARSTTPMSFMQTKVWRICAIFVGVLALVADSLIATGLMLELWTRRHGNPILSQSQALAMDVEDPFAPRPLALVIDRIILICFSTNLMTCLSTLAAIILFYGTTTMYWMPVSYIASRLFSICFISLILQSRRLKNPRRVPGTIPPNQPQIPLQAFCNPRSSLNEAQPSDLEAGLPEFIDPSTSVVTTIEEVVTETVQETNPVGTVPS